MRILVTGGAGFIGSHIVEYFKNEEIVVLDDLRTGFKENLNTFNINFVKASITNYKLIRKIMEGIEYVFHLAALVSVPESINLPELTEQINVMGTLNLLKAAKEAKVKKFIFSSSSAIYGENLILPKRENMSKEPQTPYAITKLIGEYYLKFYQTQFDLPTVSLRYFNVFGPRQNPLSQYAAVIPIFISSALVNKDLVIFGDGGQTRDFVYVKDVALVNALMLEKGEGVYNVGSGLNITINELAKKIIKLTGSKSSIVYTASRSGDIKHSSADVSLIKKIGIECSKNLEKGLKETIEFYMAAKNKGYRK